MNRTLRVGQAVDLLFLTSDKDSLECSSSDNESGGDKIEDPDFVVENLR